MNQNTKDLSSSGAKTFYIHTYGCQMNVRDSELVTNNLLAHGYTLSDSEENADIIIINSCSVRGKAEDKAIGKARLLCARRRSPDVVVGLMGCMAQRFGEDIFEQVRGLSFAVGTRAESRIPLILKRLEMGEDNISETGNFDDDTSGSNYVAPLGEVTETRISSFVTILLGCDRRCTYCIVPDVRGKEHSRQPAEIIAEIRALADSGISEITLLGQSVMNYGKRDFKWSEDIPSPMGFTEPLPRLFELIVANIPEITRIRFTSSHPTGVTDELISAMSRIPQLCRHLHLPLQSGSDRILKLMRRGYDTATYLDALKRLREALPDLAVTTDIIVGFPGETEEDFEATRKVMEEAQFDNSFIFKYSPRPGTPAAELESGVTEEEKMRRNRILLEDQDRRGLAINNRSIGTVTEVLAEGPSLRNPKRWSGRNSQNKIVLFEPGSRISVGDTVLVRITRARPQTLFGDLVEKSEI
ncbi:MAG: tRNA (N6-isopentenyl adenosine(37)-C2)-methylthiotransferase MiaB [Lentisphaerae bacterium]|jgi:tRNA-2-methylthio-N6-dimethylallyladenosine synthase|nr:tRNA (N6-isopentenyl adenosine(37)-C2)-methylthiotransferase MiaB [Lentisphaerota bacterium]